DALGCEVIDLRAQVWVAKRHAAHHHLAVGNRKPGLQYVRKAQERRLRAGRKTELSRAHHDRLQEHPIVEPGAELKIAVDGEEQADGRIEEQEIAAMLAVHLVLVLAGDAELAIKPPPAGAPPRQIGLAPLLRIIVELPCACLTAIIAIGEIAAELALHL